MANPHEYALIYGSPVPGYRAPEATVGPASRVPVAFMSVRRDAVAGGDMPAGDCDGDGPGLGGALAEQTAAITEALTAVPGLAAVPPEVVVRAVIAWTQLFGMISFELFGQFVGSFEPADAIFGYAVDQMAAFVGL